MKSRVFAILAFLLLAIGGTDGAFAQQCPSSPPSGYSASAARMLTGQLIYHNGIRQWFELKLDKPVCGKASIQLIADEPLSNQLERLRGCRVESSGTIDFATTGYYSLDLFQFLRRLTPTGTCAVKPLPPNYSGYHPDKRIRSYTVYMHFDYRPGDHPVTFRVRAGHKELAPWQAYANYDLTGSFVLYGECGKGFFVDGVFGTPAALLPFDEQDEPDGKATFDPEAAAQSGKFDLHLGYTCTRG